MLTKRKQISALLLKIELTPLWRK